MISERWLKEKSRNMFFYGKWIWVNKKARAGRIISSIVVILLLGTAIPVWAKVHDTITCTDCHLNMENISSSTVRPCLYCHSSGNNLAQGKGAPSIDLLHKSGTKSPTCAACHGNHDILKPDDPAAPVYWKNIPDLCGKCHMNPTYQDSIPQVSEYKQSRHGQLAMQKNSMFRAAVCTDCHGIHPVINGGRASLILHRPEVPGTCRKCHEHEYIEYSTSVHGLALVKGDQDAAVCIDCHSEHNIVSPTDIKSPMYAGNVVQTCNRCHASENFVRLHNLPGERALTYNDTYHGIANKYGDIKVANCVSCHGGHNILPASDPNSTINAKHLNETCAKCHTGAENWMSVGQIHLSSTGIQGTLLRKTKIGYAIFVGLIMFVFICYIILDLLAYWRLKQKGKLDEFHKQIESLPKVPDKYLVRMTQTERCQHYSLQFSFLILVISGMALLFPNTYFAQLVFAASGGIEGRAIVHRVGAALLIGSSVYLVLWMMFTPRGRIVGRNMIPDKSDFINFWIMVKFLLGFSDERPKFGLFSFIEKFEMWTVVWGMGIMGASGVIMTFTDWSLRYLPKWLWDASKIVHGLEATLALLAITIWHHYHVWFRPGFPNNAWTSGKLSFEQFVHEHPLEYEKALAEEGISNDGTAQPSQTVKTVEKEKDNEIPVYAEIANKEDGKRE